MIKKTIIVALVLAFAFCTGDFISAKYQAQTRNAKQNQLWSAVISNAASAPYPSALEQASILAESMEPSLNHVADSLPEGRKKLVHSVGSVTKAQFVPTDDSPYTGFFKGADSLIIRFSTAKEPNYTKTEAKDAYDNFVPGLGLKFLIDGQPSANLFAMHGVNGVYSYNFFDMNFNTHIPGPEGVQLTIVANKFSQGTKIVQYLGLRKLAEHTQDGTPVSNPKFPYMLTLKPVQQAKNYFTSNYTEDYRQTLKKIPSGTTLFEVYATESPVQACQKKIGYIQTTSFITPSYFGDTGLFFQHQDFTNDLEVYPQWQPYTPYWKLFGNRKPNKEEGKCPFASLFN